MTNSIWKKPDIKPDGKDTYIAITTDGLICDFVSPKMCDNSVDRWAYLTDIIAQADKAERLQKAVDCALNWLHTIATAHHPTTTYYNLDAQSAINEIKQLTQGE